MSFVTTATSVSVDRSAHIAAISELLPVPTGPPIPIRSARALSVSGCKEPPLLRRVGQRTLLDHWRRVREQVSGSGSVVRSAGERVDVGGISRHPTGRRSIVKRQQLHGG